MSAWTDAFRVDVPEGVSGAWSVSRFTVDEQAAKWEALRSAIHASGRGVPAGTYTQLRRGGTLVKSDTPDEIRDHSGAYFRAKGRVLVVGLGLGMVTQAILRKPDVEHVTVIEQSPDVIRLVGPHMTAKFPGRATIIEADIFEWTPPKGARWDVAWFDIWDGLCTDNLDEMATLNRRFARRAAWKGCWGQELLRYRRQRESRYAWR